LADRVFFSVSARESARTIVAGVSKITENALQRVIGITNAVRIMIQYYWRGDVILADGLG